MIDNSVCLCCGASPGVAVRGVSLRIRKWIRHIHNVWCHVRSCISWPGGSFLPISYPMAPGRRASSTRNDLTEREWPPPPPTGDAQCSRQKQRFSAWPLKDPWGGEEGACVSQKGERVASLRLRDDRVRGVELDQAVFPRVWCHAEEGGVLCHHRLHLVARRPDMPHTLTQLTWSFQWEVISTGSRRLRMSLTTMVPLRLPQP